MTKSSIRLLEKTVHPVRTQVHYWLQCVLQHIQNSNLHIKAKSAARLKSILSSFDGLSTRPLLLWLSEIDQTKSTDLLQFQLMRSLWTKHIFGTMVDCIGNVRSLHSGHGVCNQSKGNIRNKCKVLENGLMQAFSLTKHGQKMSLIYRTFTTV